MLAASTLRSLKAESRDHSLSGRCRAAPCCRARTAPATLAELVADQAHVEASPVTKVHPVPAPKVLGVCLELLDGVVLGIDADRDELHVTPERGPELVLHLSEAGRHDRADVAALV